MQKSDANIQFAKKKTGKSFGYSFVLLLFFIAAVTFSENLNAQHATSSPYSRYGIGQIVERGFGRNHAMGGTGIAQRTPYHLSNINPASHTSITQNSFLFDVGVNSRISQYSTALQQQMNYDTNVGYVAMAFPISKWWYCHAGLSQVSTVGYNISRVNDLGALGTNEAIYKGSGGINQVYLSNGFKFAKHFSVGINAAYYFGPIEQSVNSQITHSEGKSILDIQKKVIVKDFYFNYGVQYFDSLKLFGKGLKYSLGIVFDNKTEINAYRINEVTKMLNINNIPSSETLLNDTISEGAIEMPMRFGVGFSLHKGNQLTFSADYKMQKWSDCQFFGENEPVTDSYFYSAGLEYTPNPRAKHYWKQMKYRFGFQYSNSYLNLPVNGSSSHNQTDYSMSFGMGFPLRNSKSMISVANFGIEFGQRGTTDNNQIKESYILMSFNLSLHGIWFIKRKIY